MSHYLTAEERYKLEAWLAAKQPVAWIAQQLGKCRQTIYNELHRGTYLHTIDYKDVPRYSAEKGQDVLRRNSAHKGRGLKIADDIAYSNFLEKKILAEKRSPAAALAEARAEGFQTSISVSTLYNYISSELFISLTDADLPEKAKRKPRRKAGKPKIAHKDLPSIESRPESINNREEYGHWELDLVVGPQGERHCLMTLTERKSREEIIIKLPNRKAKTIRKAFNKLEKETENFKEKFKSITTDNGSEFMEYDKLIKSIYGGKRFQMYYCHSYASWEKGTNETHNRMIRRFFPKGTNFATVTRKQVQEVQDWMNNYPRKILGWKTPLQVASTA